MPSTRVANRPSAGRIVLLWTKMSSVLRIYYGLRNSYFFLPRCLIKYIFIKQYIWTKFRNCCDLVFFTSFFTLYIFGYPCIISGLPTWNCSLYEAVAKKNDVYVGDWINISNRFLNEPYVHWWNFGDTL